MEENQTIFHKIIRKEIPADILYEDERVIAIKDVAPASPTHLLVIPKKTLPSLSDAKTEDCELLGHMLLVIRDLASKSGITEEGYRVVINSGERAGQTVFQLHMHLLSGRDFSWPPG
jgi:histidine triad (HIT) family protein